MILHKNKFIMCHHFHDNKQFKKIRGSLSKSKFENIVKKNLKKKYIYTFDDSLKSQYYIAKPILEKYNLKGIFFINTFQFDKKYNYHEISKFFEKFFFKTNRTYSLEVIKNFLLLNKGFKFKKNFNKEKKLFPFYDINEIKLRDIRNKKLSSYNKTLKKIFLLKNFKYKLFHKKIYMNKKEVIEISKKHKIGLHTHTHPYDFKNIAIKKQFKEIYYNKKILENMIKINIDTFSYPTGGYNNYVIETLKRIKILSAFKNNSNVEKVKNSNKNYLIPRININQL